jgi:hypothetical protein
VDTDAAAATTGRPPGRHRPAPTTEDGSIVAEYGLVAALGATIVGLVISWMKGGALTSLLGALLQQLRAVIAA